MAIRKILKYPRDEKQLRMVSQPVGRVDSTVRKLIKDLKDTLAQQPGVGLSAPQIGILKRVAIIKLGQTHGGPDDELSKPIPLIDPQIIFMSAKEVKDYDGCLSVPNLYGYTYRSEKIILSTFGMDGNRYQMQLSGLDARVALHEIDHFDGILFMERIRSSEDLFVITRDKSGNGVLVPIDAMRARA
jgi:peptide deformylase